MVLRKIHLYYIFSVCLLFHYIFYHHFNEEFTVTSQSILTSENKIKYHDPYTKPKILVWKKPWNNFPNSPIAFKYCYPNDDCEIEFGNSIFGPSSNQMNTADAIVMLPLWRKGPSTFTQTFGTLEKLRKSGKLLIFFMMESTYYNFNRKVQHTFLTRNKIDFSMTFRSDSSFPYPYGTLISSKMLAFKNKFPEDFEKRVLTTDEINKFYKTHIDDVFRIGKSQGAISLVSNCKGFRRGEVITFFDKYFNWKNGTKALDVFGKCQKKYQPEVSKIRLDNTKNISQSGHQQNSALISRYYFVLAFENSNCTEYITEKFFAHAYMSGTVPVVMGQPRTVYEKIAPGESFVHIDDFGGDWAGLVKYLQKFIGNEKEYRKTFFSWVDDDTVDVSVKFQSVEDLADGYGFCKLCKTLKNRKNGLSGADVLKHDNNDDWWNNKTCESYS